MLLRFMFLSLISLSLNFPVLAATLYPIPDERLSVAASKFREHQYREAAEAASLSPQSGIRDFLLGMAAYKQERWEEAASSLSRCAVSFPLLLDYALYYEASALYRLNRLAEAAEPLQRLATDFPASPLFRSAQILSADILYDSGDFRGARVAYQKFIEKFPSGSDSLSATYKSAICLEKLGDITGAVASLRTIWLKYPASPIAPRAEEDLQRISLQGAKVDPYSPDELLQRGMTLYDLRKYDQAASVFQNVTTGRQPESSAGKYLLRGGLALFKARRYKEAERAFSSLLYRKIDRETYEEAYLWLGMSLNKNGKGDDAYAVFTKLADAAANPELGDKALLEAAFIRKNQNRPDEAVALLKRIVICHPKSTLKQRATWEIAWVSFKAGDMKTAAEYLQPLTEDETFREKALYWYARALMASGDTGRAQSAGTALLAEFPFGFYAQSYREEARMKDDDISLPISNLCEFLPLPSGYDRIKALITFGLYDEARKELSTVKKKPVAKNGALPGLARLYLEMGDYNGAYNMLGNEQPRKLEKDNQYKWGLCFPLAFREQVAQMSAEFAVPEGLIYAVIRAESSFSPTALSPAGAVGLMQLMPATAATISNGSKKEFNADSLTNPKTNIRYGVKHLKDLITLYKGDTILAVAAYNAGAGNVNRWRKAFGNLRKDEFVENIPFAETREYVKKVISGADIYDRLYKLDSPSKPVPKGPRPEDAPEPQKPQTQSPERAAAAQQVMLSRQIGSEKSVSYRSPAPSSPCPLAIKTVDTKVVTV